ncbi:hypothetical protein KSD_76660 [Ktedonobacter sp. SOSP1-85]|nr:hypothetical protein KSD_76660 [Ktedonobacter sp. SOSP1-85]
MKKLSTVSLTQATDKGTPHSSPCLKGQGHPAAISVKKKGEKRMSARLQNKVAIVTGASRGIG